VTAAVLVKLCEKSFEVEVGHAEASLLQSEVLRNSINALANEIAV
jgi:hypothetical protein